MKKIIISMILTVGLASLILDSCSKSFLETNSSTDISDNLIYQDPETAEGVLFGIYKYMRSWGCTSAGATRADCCGLHTNLITFDVMANDINMQPGSWYWFDYDYWHTADEVLFKTSHFWEFYYVIINNCNNILVNIDSINGDPDKKNSVKGQALALRAFSYHHLIQLYQQTYAIAKDEPGVPIYTEPGNGSTINSPRRSVSEVYQLILDDLNEAIKILPVSRESKYYVNRNVAEGLLARVYLTMNDWNNASLHAKEAMSGYEVMSADEWLSGFNSNNISEWIWGIHQSTDQNVGWGSSFGFFDYINGNQKTMRICSTLKDCYSDTDVRKSLIALAEDGLYGNQKFREPATLNTGHMVLMRASEMVLIQAEAAARLGQDALAHDLLYSLVSKRDQNYVKTEKTGKELVEEILLERRKELWGEGFGLFDMLRTQKGLERTGDAKSTKYFEPTSWKYIFCIPRKEVDVNEGISEEDQNPVEGTYL